MALKDHPGFKRVAVFATFASFVITFILLIVGEGRVSPDELFFEFSIIAASIALITFVFVRGTYWVIDGFKKDE